MLNCVQQIDQEMVQALKGGSKKGQPTYPYDFCNKAKRLQGIAQAPNLDRKDPLMAHLLKNVETLFQPKSVCSDGDWLVTQQEPGQTFQTYQ